MIMEKRSGASGMGAFSMPLQEPDGDGVGEWLASFSFMNGQYLSEFNKTLPSANRIKEHFLSRTH